jgi:hypothetical protein
MVRRRGWRKRKTLPTRERETRPKVVEFSFEKISWMTPRKRQKHLSTTSDPLAVRHLRVMQAVQSAMKLAGADNPAPARSLCHGECPRQTTPATARSCQWHV